VQYHSASKTRVTPHIAAPRSFNARDDVAEMITGLARAMAV
jgi:hypothetical protein